MLAAELQERVKPDGLAIVMEADHFCIALARREGRRIGDDQLGDARRLPERCQPAARIPVAPLEEERELIMLVRLMYASRAADSVGTDELAAILRRSRQGQPCQRHHRAAVPVGRHLPAGARGRALAGQRALLTASPPTRGTATWCCSATRRSASAASPAWAMGLIDLSRLNPALLLKYSEGRARPLRALRPGVDGLVRRADRHRLGELLALSCGRGLTRPARRRSPASSLRRTSPKPLYLVGSSFVAVVVRVRGRRGNRAPSRCRRRSGSGWRRCA